MNPLQSLASRIRRDLDELERVLGRAHKAWQKCKHSDDDYYLDSVALNLHGLYSGVERVLERIAATIDGAKPTGENWHQVLLQQMIREMPGVRPAVISEVLGEQLEEYRGFRHVVRNVYVFNFDPAKLESLILSANPMFSKLKEELLAFAQFLDEQTV